MVGYRIEFILIDHLVTKRFSELIILNEFKKNKQIRIILDPHAPHVSVPKYCK